MDNLPTDLIIYLIKFAGFLSFVRFIRSNKRLKNLLNNPEKIRNIFEIPLNENLLLNLKARFKYFAFDQFNDIFIGRQCINPDFNKFELSIGNSFESFCFGLVKDPIRGPKISDIFNYKNVYVFIGINRNQVNQLECEIYYNRRLFRRGLLKSDLIKINATYKLNEDNNTILYLINDIAFTTSLLFGNCNYYPCYQIKGKTEIEFKLI